MKGGWWTLGRGLSVISYGSFQISCDSKRPFGIMEVILPGNSYVLESSPTTLMSAVPEAFKWVNSLQTQAWRETWKLWIKGQLQ